MLIRRRHEPIARYGIAMLCPLICIPIDQILGLGLLQDTPYLLLFLAVLVSAWYGGIGPGLLSTLITLCLLVVFHFEPIGAFEIRPEYLSRLGIFMLAAVMTSVLGAARLTAESELRARQEELETTLSSIGDAVIATDTHGVITFLNPVAARLVGWSRDEAIGRRMEEIFVIINESTRQTVESPVARVIREGKVVGLANHTVLVARDGTETPIDDSAAPIRSENGELRGVVLVFHDIGERRVQEKIRAELLQALENERMRIDDLVSSVPGVVWEAWGKPDQAEQRIGFVSEYVEQLLGYSRAEWLGQPNFWLSIVHPEDRERAAAEAAANFESGRISQSQFRWIARDGHIVWVEAHSMVVCDDAGNQVGMRGVTMDITVRKRAEEALRDSEERFRSMADSAPVMIWVSDISGQIIYFNRLWLDFTGKSFDEQTGDQWAGSLHAEDRDRIVDTYLSLLSERKRFRMEYRLRRHDGVYRWILDTGVPRYSVEGEFEGYIGSCFDITEIKEAENSLRRWEQLFKHAGWGVVTVDPETNRLLTVNPSFAAMHGYSVEQMIDMPLQEIFAPEERENIPGHIEDAHELGHYLYESMHITREGRCFPVLADVIVVRDDNGQILYRAANFQDITERKRAEQELRSAMEAAEAANLAKNNFLAMLSHELRTPLTPVFTAAHLLAEASGLSEEDQVLVTMIRQSVELEARLIDDLLELTRIDQGKLHLSVESVDVHDVIINALAFCQQELSTNDQTVTLELDAEASWIEADMARLQQVFWNLIKNAVKFSRKGAGIDIRTGNPAQGIVRVSVIDHGIGIEQEHLTRIFKPFEQAEATITRRYGGLGLGLAITSAIVRLHGGSITASSPGPDQGATFSIDLPVRHAGGDARGNGELYSDDDALSFSALRVLVIAERMGARGIVNSLLENQGYQIHLCETPEAALGMAGSIVADVVIIDLEITTDEAVALFTELCRRNPIHGILIGEELEEHEVERLRQSGIEEYLARPITLNLLRGAIHRVVG